MLKHEDVRTADLKVGDVIDDDYGYWQVATITDNGDGTFAVLDCDDNGTDEADADDDWTILDRTMFRTTERGRYG